MSGKKLLRRPLSVREILLWADAHREATGKWPTRYSGTVAAAKFETWANIDNALRAGLRDLDGGSSLAQLLTEHRGVRNLHRLPPLTEEQILGWADAHHQRTGTWPAVKSGIIPDTGGETWRLVDEALSAGNRDLTGGSSLARLLARHRGTRNRKQLPPLTEEQILGWADAHHQRTGTWPTARAGPIPESPGETWTAVDMALRKGLRKMTGGSSLALLLAEKRAVRNLWTRPDLTVAQVLGWADAYFERTGEWPQQETGAIREAPGETWKAVDKALKRGSRGLPSLSLARLLAQERGVRNRSSIPNLTRKQILAWADAYRHRTGEWPTPDAGPIPEAPEETWKAVDAALRQGCRKLRGGSSLARLLAAHRGRKNIHGLPRLSQRKVLAWADAHFQRTGQWPNRKSGAVFEAPHEDWRLIDVALRQGQRRLPGGSSLLKLLVRKRGLRNPLSPPPLTEAQVLKWADLHRQRTGSFPRYDSGPITDAPGETWAGVDSALRYGKRGFAAGSSLAKLLAAQSNGAAGDPTG